MHCIIAGSRSIDDYAALEKAIEVSGLSERIDTVVSGGAKGVDELAEQWAYRNSKNLLVIPAKWAKYGRAAGPIRNKEMLKYATALIAVWDGKSKGTKNMIDEATRSELLIHVHNIKVKMKP